MRVQSRCLEEDLRQRVFLTAGVRAEMETSEGPCSRCGGPTVVQKSVEHRVVTLEYGDLIAHETVRTCKARCRPVSGKGTLMTRRSETLPLKVRPGSIYGYDLEVHVGLERFLHHRQREEIRGELAQRHGINLSSGQVSELGSRFLEHIEVLHWRRAPELHEAMTRDGGYPLHIDATGEGGRGTLLVAFAGWRHWVLGAWKLPTERAEFILPAIRSVAQSFGNPCAIVRDLGRAMKDAADEFVRSLKRPIPILACHLHFLSDVGGDLLEEGHTKLRHLFRTTSLLQQLRAFSRQQGRNLGKAIDEGRSGLRLWLAESNQGHRIPDGAPGMTIVRSFAQWVLDYRADGADQGFPFDLPYLDLYTRCLEVGWATETFLRQPPADAKVRKALEKLWRILRPVQCDVPPFHCVGLALDKRADLFAELRQTLRLHDVRPASEIDPEREAKKLNDVQAAVETLTASLRQRRPERGPAKDLRQAIDLVLSHLDRHGPHLWGHVIDIPKECGGGIRLVDRTNNILETWFRSLKHGERRRSGRKILSQDFERLPPSAALAVNLAYPDYVEILCGSLDHLPAAFAKFDVDNGYAALSSNQVIANIETASLSTGDRELTRISALEQRIAAAAHCR